MTVVAVLIATEGSVPGSFAASPWADVDGHPLVWHAARRLGEAGATHIVLVADPARASPASAVGSASGARVSCVTVGGEDGVRAVFTRALADDPSVVLVHDPARAFAPVAMIHRVVDAVRNGADVVVPVLPVVDTIRAAGTDGQVSALVDRERLRIVQSPQGFAPDVLRRRYGRPGSSVEAVDDRAAPSDAAGAAAVPRPPGTTGVDELAAAVAAGEKLTTVEGHADADRVRAARGSGPPSTGTDPTGTGWVAAGGTAGSARGRQDADA